MEHYASGSEAEEDHEEHDDDEHMEVGLAPEDETGDGGDVGDDILVAVGEGEFEVDIVMSEDEEEGWVEVESSMTGAVATGDEMAVAEALPAESATGDEMAVAEAMPADSAHPYATSAAAKKGLAPQCRIQERAPDRVFQVWWKTALSKCFSWKKEAGPILKEFGA
jgi:hypothetical protein